MVISSIFWLPFIGTAAYYETMGYVETTDAMMSYYRWILILELRSKYCGFHIIPPPRPQKGSNANQKTQWFTLSVINLGTIITIYAFISSYLVGEAIETYPRGYCIIRTGNLSILVYWIKETFICLYMAQNTDVLRQISSISEQGSDSKRINQYRSALGAKPRTASSSLSTSLACSPISPPKL